MHLNDIHKETTGTGIRMAIIDTGLNLEFYAKHTSNIVGTYNVLDGSMDVTDYHGHGTEMVSILLGDEEHELYGIAPDVSLLIIKAIDASGSTDNSNISKAIDYAVDFGVDIINLSLGSHNNDERVEKSVENAIKSNIVIVAACGDYAEPDLLFPAAYSDVISVQGIDENNNLVPMSNHSNDIVLYMPGENIDCLHYSDDGTAVLEKTTGSSEATVIASGYIALMLSYAHNYNLSLNNNKLISIFNETVLDDGSLDYKKPFTIIKSF